MNISLKCKDNLENSFTKIHKCDATRIWDKFESDGTEHNVHKKHSEKPWSSTSTIKKEQFLETLCQSPQKSVRQMAREIGIPKSSTRSILKWVCWKYYAPILTYTLNKDDPDQIVEFYVYLGKCWKIQYLQPKFFGLMWPVFSYIAQLSTQLQLLGSWKSAF